MSTIQPKVGSSPRAGCHQGRRQGCSLAISEASSVRASGDGVTAAVGPLAEGSVCRDLGPQARVAQERAIGLDVRVAGGEQLLTVEDRIGARQKAQHLSLAAQ